MLLNIRCPDCGQMAQVPQDAINKSARCDACHCTFFVKDVVVHPGGGTRGASYMASSRKLASASNLGKPASAAGNVVGASKPTFWSSDMGVVVAIIAPVLLIGAIVAGWMLWSRHVAEQVQAQIVKIKAEADSELAAGKTARAARHYAELLTLARDNGWSDDPQLLADAQRKKEAAHKEANKRRQESLARIGSRSQSVDKDEYANHPHDDSLTRLRDIQTRFEAKVHRGDTDFSDIRRELQPYQEEARQRVSAMNRAPGEPGYSLEVRRKAAYMTLIQQGFSPSEARKDVEAMEQTGMLPDPPRR